MSKYFICLLLYLLYPLAILNFYNNLVICLFLYIKYSYNYFKVSYYVYVKCIKTFWSIRSCYTYINKVIFSFFRD